MNLKKEINKQENHLVCHNGTPLNNAHIVKRNLDDVAAVSIGLDILFSNKGSFSSSAFSQITNLNATNRSSGLMRYFGQLISNEDYIPQTSWYCPDIDSTMDVGIEICDDNGKINFQTEDFFHNISSPFSMSSQVDSTADVPTVDVVIDSTKQKLSVKVVTERRDGFLHYRFAELDEKGKDVTGRNHPDNKVFYLAIVANDEPGDMYRFVGHIEITAVILRAIDTYYMEHRKVFNYKSYSDAAREMIDGAIAKAQTVVEDAGEGEKVKVDSESDIAEYTKKTQEEINNYTNNSLVHRLLMRNIGQNKKGLNIIVEGLQGSGKTFGLHEATKQLQKLAEQGEVKAPDGTLISKIHVFFVGCHAGKDSSQITGGFMPVPNHLVNKDENSSNGSLTPEESLDVYLNGGNSNSNKEVKDVSGITVVYVYGDAFSAIKKASECPRDEIVVLILDELFRLSPADLSFLMGLSPVKNDKGEYFYRFTSNEVTEVRNSYGICGNVLNVNAYQFSVLATTNSGSAHDTRKPDAAFLDRFQMIHYSLAQEQFERIISLEAVKNGWGIESSIELAGKIYALSIKLQQLEENGKIASAPKGLRLWVDALNLAGSDLDLFKEIVLENCKTKHCDDQDALGTPDQQQVDEIKILLEFFG